MRYRLFVFLPFAAFFMPFTLPLALAEDIESGLIKENAYLTEHYRIEFSDLLLEQGDADGNGLPDIVDIVAEAAEYSREVLIEDLNYEDPMKGIDRELIIVLDDTNQYLIEGSLGVTSVLSNGDPYVAIDPWLSSDYLKVTVGHELFHTVQFGYGLEFAYTEPGQHWAEQTATWVEDLQYDEINDYVNYIPEYFDNVDYSIFASITPEGSLFEYGLNIWPRFLSEYYGNDVIKEIWESYLQAKRPYESNLRFYEAIKEALAFEGDEELWELYRTFTVWNLALDPYEEGESYPAVLSLSGETSEVYQEINESYAPALYGSNYIYFDNESEEESFYFTIAKPEGVSFSVTLAPLEASSVDLENLVQVFVDTDEEMNEVLELGNLSEADGVYAIVSALEKEDRAFNQYSDFDEGYLYYFFAQYADADRNYSVDEINTTEGSTGETTEVKEGQQGGSPEIRVPDYLILNLITYDEDSVSLSWNRLNNPDIEGYELRYGVHGEEEQSLFIQADYITSATVKSLKEGQSYFFEILALDGAGDFVGEPSMSITVTPQEWLFTDLSYLDDYYGAISALTEEEIFKGYADGSFLPNKDINRAELLKILIEGQGITPDPTIYKNCFSDVEQAWYAKYVCYAKEQEWIQGYSDGSFRPGNTVNKVEALKMLFEVYEEGLNEGQVVSDLPYPDLLTDEWYSVYVDEASDLGILEETPGESFDATDGRTRAEMALELYRYLVLMDLIRE